MQRDDERVTIHVDGMTCSHCELRIEGAVRGLAGVREVRASASLGEVTVVFEPGSTDLATVHAAIRGAGYEVREAAADVPAVAAGGEGGAEAPAAPATRPTALYRFLGLLAVVAAGYLIIRYTVGLQFLPTVSQSMGYGLIFVVGLLTSLHCIAMCGGIVLSQGIKRREIEADEAAPPGAFDRLLPSILYNGGRVVSYTIIGGIVGAVGSLFSLSSALKGVMPVIAGAFMLFLGIRMLGIFPWLSRLKVRIPGLPSHAVTKASSRRGPFVVGLLNGLMPCGPLQTMQVYALGTGSFYAGALSMFLFSVGTVPLLLGFGLISSLLSAKFNRRMVKASGVLVMVLGLVMFSRGLNLFGVSLPGIAPASTSSAIARVTGPFQVVRSTVESGTYHPIVVQAGVPVRWTINVKADDINGCNSPLTVPSYDIRRELTPGDNVIEFTPTAEGDVTYTCWMGMITSTIHVVADVTKVTSPDDPISPAGARYPQIQQAPAIASGAAGAGCCGPTPAAFAGGKIPVDTVQVAKISNGSQVAEVRVDANGYTPAVLVLQRGVKAKIRFVAAQLDSCNSVVVFPEYQGSLDLSKGRLETPLLDVQSDFTFECGMGMLHGYVKVVDDITKVNLAAVKQEVAGYQPVSAGGGGAGGGCCGN